MTRESLGSYIAAKLTEYLNVFENKIFYSLQNFLKIKWCIIRAFMFIRFFNYLIMIPSQ